MLVALVRMLSADVAAVVGCGIVGAAIVVFARLVVGADDDVAAVGGAVVGAEVVFTPIGCGFSGAIPHSERKVRKIKERNERRKK